VRTDDRVYVARRGGLFAVSTLTGTEILILPKADGSALAPSGDRLAVTDGHDISVVELASGAVTPLEPVGTDLATYAWTPDSAALRVVRVRYEGLIEHKEIRTESLHPVGPPRAARPPNDCAARLHVRDAGGCGGFYLGRHVLVRIEGCSGGHWMPPQPTSALFTATCDAMLFAYDGQVFITSTASRRIAHLASGTLVALTPR